MVNGPLTEVGTGTVLADGRPQRVAMDALTPDVREQVQRRQIPVPLGGGPLATAAMGARALDEATGGGIRSVVNALAESGRTGGPMPQPNPAMVRALGLEGQIGLKAAGVTPEQAEQQLAEAQKPVALPGLATEEDEAVQDVEAALGPAVPEPSQLERAAGEILEFAAATTEGARIRSNRIAAQTQKIAELQAQGKEQEANSLQRVVDQEREIQKLIDNGTIEDPIQGALERVRSQREIATTAIRESNAAQDRGIDPNRFINGLSMPKKILAGIAVALGGVGKAIAGDVRGPNLGLQAIQRAIDQDIELQREEISRKGAKATQAVNLLDMLQGQLQTEIGAEDTFRQIRWAQAENEVRLMQAKAAPGILREQGNLAAQQVKAKADEAAQKAAMETGVAVMETLQKDAEAALKAQGKDVTAERTPFGTFRKKGQTPSAPEAERASKLMTQMEQTSFNMREMINLATESGNEIFVPGTDANRVFKSLAAQLLTDNAIERGQGAMSEGDRDVMTDITGGTRELKNIFTGGAEGVVRFMKGALDRSIRQSDKKLGKYGLLPETKRALRFE